MCYYVITVRKPIDMKQVVKQLETASTQSHLYQLNEFIEHTSTLNYMILIFYIALNG